GGLSSSGTSTLSGGTLGLSGPATLAVLRQTGGSLQQAGAGLDIGQLELQGGVFAADGAASIASLALQGGQIGGAGDFVIGNLAWTAGTLAGTGARTVSAGAVMDGPALTLDGAALTLAGSSRLAGGSTLHMQNGAQLTIPAAASLRMGDAAISGSGLIANAGRMVKDEGSGSARIAPLLDNSGTVESGSGALAILGGGGGGGRFLIDGGADLVLGGSRRLQSFAQLGGGGTLLFGDASHIAIDETLNVVGTTADLDISVGRLAGVAVETPPAAGALAVTGSTRYTYTAPDGFAGTDQAQGRLIDRNGNSGLVDLHFIVRLPEPNGPAVLPGDADLIAASQRALSDAGGRGTAAGSGLQLASLSAAERLADIATAAGPDAGASRSEVYVDAVQGTVYARSSGGGLRLLAADSALQPGETIATAAGSSGRVAFSDGTVVDLAVLTELRIDAYSYDELAPQQDRVAFTLLLGGIRVQTGLAAGRSPAAFALDVGDVHLGAGSASFEWVRCAAAWSARPPCATARTQYGVAVDGLFAVDRGNINVTRAGAERQFAAGSGGALLPDARAPGAWTDFDALRQLFPELRHLSGTLQ
ncbi:MAG: hypothetical protein JNJ60_04985, partial [Rhodocyclaceae bacterium]|nr:hypothetical protein [Rhodocyclaceae bacterium]